MNKHTPTTGRNGFSVAAARALLPTATAVQSTAGAPATIRQAERNLASTMYEDNAAQLQAALYVAATRTSLEKGELMAHARRLVRLDSSLTTFTRTGGAR